MSGGCEPGSKVAAKLPALGSLNGYGRIEDVARFAAPLRLDDPDRKRFSARFLSDVVGELLHLDEDSDLLLDWERSKPLAALALFAEQLLGEFALSPANALRGRSP